MIRCGILRATHLKKKSESHTFEINLPKSTLSMISQRAREKITTEEDAIEQKADMRDT